MGDKSPKSKERQKKQYGGKDEAGIAYVVRSRFHPQVLDLPAW